MPKGKVTHNRTLCVNAEMVAKTLATVRPINLFTNTEARLQWYGVVAHFAVLFREADPKFVPHVFFDMCGVPN